jgi:hypothetical protein
MKYHVFGDTGGHFDQLVSALYAIGANVASYKLPEDVTVIHVGDLIHKGPGTSQVLALVDMFIHKNPGRWIQLLGNHEAQHVNFGTAPHFWECLCTPDEEAILQDWWDTGKMVSAHGVDKILPHTLTEQIDPEGKLLAPYNDNGVLFTHAGLTRLWWNKVLGGETHAPTVAAKLNAMPLADVTAPGLLLGVPNSGVGPVWAIGNSEVYPSWYKPFANGAPGLPFVQVHGHTTAINWQTGQWRPMVSNAFKKHSVVDVQRRIIATQIGEGMLVSIDPGFEDKADLLVQPMFMFDTYDES